MICGLVVGGVFDFTSSESSDPSSFFFGDKKSSNPVAIICFMKNKIPGVKLKIKKYDKASKRVKICTHFIYQEITS